MTQRPKTVLLRGGLDLVSPPAAMPSGRAIAALNYEPEVRGYRRIGGIERYDGRPEPSKGTDAADADARRAAIGPVPGTGQVRGVQVYDGTVWAFRDSETGGGAMYKATTAGWILQSFGHEISFTNGLSEFFAGETLLGTTSGATARIERVVLRSGTWGADASGYLVVSGLDGSFQVETATSDSGEANVTAEQQITLEPGGRYDFENHNFYGATSRQRMYFTNGVDTAMEWDGTVLAPLRTGNSSGVLDNKCFVKTRDNDFVLTRSGANVILRGEFDKPQHIGQYKDHLFLSFSETIIHSAIGEPLDYRAIAGAAEINFGSYITGFLSSAATSIVVFGESKVEYITGSSAADFEMLPLSDNAGAIEWTQQMSGEQPVYLDQAGARRLSTTSAFGGWRMGTITQLVEPLIRQKLEAGVAAVASVNVRKKDQYRLFYGDQTGLTTYLGRREVETLPFRLPISVSCACAGKISGTEGERVFVGSDDGYVYEMDAGTSFDGSSVEAYLRLAWNNVDAPHYNSTFASVTFEIDGQSDMTIGVRYDVDYGIDEGVGGTLEDQQVVAGSQELTPSADFDDIDWTQPFQGRLKADTPGYGVNIAPMIVTNHTTEQPHTISTMHVNHSYRGLNR